MHSSPVGLADGRISPLRMTGEQNTSSHSYQGASGILAGGVDWTEMHHMSSRIDSRSFPLHLIRRSLRIDEPLIEFSHPSSSSLPVCIYRPMLPQFAPERPPSTPNEKGILFILSFFFVLFLFFDWFQQYSPAKLAVPFFFLSWAILLVAHELGHAAMAALLGWRVEKICLGMGKIFFLGRIAGLSVELRAIPISGYIQPRPTNLNFPRLKQFLIYGAGPGIELVLVAILAVLIGRESLLTSSSDPAIIAAQSFCVAAILGAGFNLIPLPHASDNGIAWSDGLGMLLCWRIPDEVFAERMRDDHTPRSDTRFSALHS